MAYFKKGVGLVKVAYKSNFEMRSLNVKFKAGGSSFTPQLYGVDGLSSVNIVDESLGKAMITAPLDVLSIDLPPEYENVGSKAFLACSNLESVYIYAGKVITIADDAFPANCVVYVDNEFLTEYQTEHPLLDIRGFNSGYLYEIPYVDGFTPTTLTAQYVNDLIDGMTLDRKTKIGKVVVPVYFTAYESGALNIIKNAFGGLEQFSMLGVPFGSLGAGVFDIFDNTGVGFVEFDYYGAKVKLPMNNIQNDVHIDLRNYVGVDQSYPFARFLGKCSHPTWTGTCYLNWDGMDANAFLSSWYTVQGNECTKIIVTGTTTRTSGWFNYAGGYSGEWNDFKKVEYLEFVDWDTSKVTSLTYLNRYNPSSTGGLGTAYIQNIKFPSNADLSNVVQLQFNAITSVNLPNLIISFSMNHQGTREQIMDTLNSLGTPDTIQTAKIGSTALAKLTQADIDAMAARNWNVVA